LQLTPDSAIGAQCRDPLVETTRLKQRNDERGASPRFATMPVSAVG
jgi:hypothetical protein